MQCHTPPCLMSVFIMLSCSAYGEGVIQQRDQVEARAANLESHLIIKLFSAMETDIKELRDEIMEQQIKHEEENSKLREEIMDLKAQSEEKPKTIFAQVQLTGEHTMSPRQRIKFTRTIANIGQAFKTTQGYFVAPYDGTYLFIVNVCTKNRYWVVFRIVKENDILSEGHPGDSSMHACASATAVTYMQTGSKVWAEIDRVSGGVITSAYGIPSFTGVLINTFQKP